MRKIKGIIFDMDNTLIRSRIDFSSMKNETFRFLTTRGLLPERLVINQHTTSTLIQEAMNTNRMTDEWLEELGEILKRHEKIGMRGAGLEPGVLDVLHDLKGQYDLALLTNNSVEAAEIALSENNIGSFFDCVVGREQVNAMKPSPDGFAYILNKFNVPAAAWLSIGDSWIDGKASEGAGIAFIAYRADRQKMKQMNVTPRAWIQDIREIKAHLD